jgi:hypothetical protein
MKSVFKASVREGIIEQERTPLTVALDAPNVEVIRKAEVSYNMVK